MAGVDHAEPPPRFHASLYCANVAFSRSMSRSSGSTVECDGAKLAFPSGRWRGIELPDTPAGGCIEGGIKAGALALTRDPHYRADRSARPLRIQMQPVANARDADDDLALIHQRCHVGSHAGRTSHLLLAQRIVRRELIGGFAGAVHVLHQRVSHRSLPLFWSRAISRASTVPMNTLP